jgi:hypothetical protein
MIINFEKRGKEETEVRKSLNKNKNKVEILKCLNSANNNSSPLLNRFPTAKRLTGKANKHIH